MSLTSNSSRMFLLVGISVITLVTIYIQLYDLDIGIFLSLMVTISALIAITAFTEYQSIKLWDLVHRGNALSNHLSEQLLEQQKMLIEKQRIIIKLKSQIK